jgi:uncharacterized protein YhfF
VTAPAHDIAALTAKLAAHGITLPAGRVTVDGYGDSPELSNDLLALIRAGRKRAGTGLMWAIEAEGQPLPQVGDIEIVIDHGGEPALVTRLTHVDIVRYADVTAEYAAIEGEGDGSLAFWRDAHWSYFTRECQRLGREPDEAMEVLCCVFELLAVVPGSGDAAAADPADTSEAP